MELHKLGLTKMLYCNSIMEILGEIQGEIRGTDAKLQLLGAGMGTCITETEEGPMLVWEAIQKLCLDTKLVGEVLPMGIVSTLMNCAQSCQTGAQFWKTCPELSR
jgi:hypothetical protein